MSDNTKPADNGPIDAVILWVDGSDARLSEKRARYLAGEQLTTAHPGAIPARFASSNEIRYCVLSILTFAPFIRNIFIVTDEQDPGLDDEVRARFPDRAGCLKIVDHREIFRDYEEYLPSFNSSSIHTMMWRIRGLSPNFIYFNDDTILIRDTVEEDWFIGGLPVLRGKWLLPPVRKIAGNSLKLLLNRYIRGNKGYRPKISFYIRQWQTSLLLGRRWRYYFHCHTAHPMRIKTLEDYFIDNEELLRKTISYRFRDAEQLLASSLAYHLEIRSGNAHLARLNLGYLHPWYSEERMNRRIDSCTKDVSIKSVCIQSIEMMSNGHRKKIFDWLDEVLYLKHEN
ncbi:MAG: Stealth CR1 domain-containing protein [Bacteroidales bacterium]